MRPSVARSYRILGVPPGAPEAEVKRAYLDLVQVWHPDRFAHDERLQDKAQSNLKRINAAYNRLRSQPTAETPDQSIPPKLLSQSYQAILGIGDFIGSGFHRVVRLSSDRAPIVGLDLDRDGHRRSRRTHRRKESRGAKFWIVVVLTLVAAAGGGAAVVLLAM